MREQVENRVDADADQGDHADNRDREQDIEPEVTHPRPTFLRLRLPGLRKPPRNLSFVRGMVAIRCCWRWKMPSIELTRGSFVLAIDCLPDRPDVRPAPLAVRLYVRNNLVTQLVEDRVQALACRAAVVRDVVHAP